MPGGSLKSKPTWSNTSGYSTTSALLFAVARDTCDGQGYTRLTPHRQRCSGFYYRVPVRHWLGRAHAQVQEFHRRLNAGTQKEETGVGWTLGDVVGRPGSRRTRKELSHVRQEHGGSGL